MRTSQQDLAYHSAGFTLIEIIIVLVLMGILAVSAVPKYFDFQENAEKKAARSSVAEAQTRIDLRFGQLLLQGYTCEKATKEVSTLSLLADPSPDRDGALFGDFVLSIPSSEISPAGSNVSAKRYGSEKDAVDTEAKLYLPQCNNVTTIADKITDIEEILKNYKKDSGYSGNIDSTAPDSDSYKNIKAFKNLLEKSGIDLSVLGATTWHADLSGDTPKFVWTSQSLDALAPGEKTTVFRYVGGQYYLYTAEKRYPASNSDKSYYVLGNIKQLSTTGTSDYNEVLEWYKNSTTAQ